MSGIVATVTSGVITEWLKYVFSERQERGKEIRARRKVASAELVAPIRDLQGLLRAYGEEEVEREVVHDACRAWAVAVKAHRHCFPRELRPAVRGVSEAVGVVFGGAVNIELDPGMAWAELPAPHRVWQDYADDYLDAVADMLLKCGDSFGRPRPAAGYDAWLRRTERVLPPGPGGMWALAGGAAAA